MNDVAARVLAAAKSHESLTPREFLRAASWHMNRELIDLARHYYGPEGMGAHHATGIDPSSGEDGLSDRASPSTTDQRERYGKPTPSEFRGPLPGGPPTKFAQKEEHFRVHEAIAQLEPDDFELIGLLFYQDLTQPEAAAVLGVDESTVKRRWRRTKIKLGQLLTQ